MPPLDPTSQLPLSPTTTVAEDLTHAGQRRVNLIWEATQAIIAIFVTLAIIYANLNKIPSPELVNAFFLIIGFYFSRTNHSAIGGVGIKPAQDYTGR